MQGRIWTVPNQITLLRLGFLPIVLILISYEHYRWALAVAVVIILISGYRPFPPSLLGKATTMFQIILVFTIVLSAAYPNLPLSRINEVLIYLVAALATVSAFHYSVSIARRLSSPAPPAS